MKKARFSVQPCDNMGTLPEAPRDRTWDVLDRVRGEVVATRDKRRQAREIARDYNAVEAERLKRCEAEKP